MITNRYSALILSLLVIVLASTYCTLEKEPVIPEGETNEESPVFLATELVRNAQNGILAKAMLESRGNLNILRHGWVWSEHPGPTIQDSSIEVGTLSSDSFATQISGLALEKTYYFRPYVATALEEIYGPEKTLALILTFQSGISFGIGNSVQQTSDGSFIVVGSFAFLTPLRMGLAKTNEVGVIQWLKLFNGSGSGNVSEGKSVQQTTDGGFILLGHIDSNMYLVKTNHTGDLQWEKTFGGIGGTFTIGNSVQQTTDGGFILLGNIGSNMFLIKTNETGVKQWAKSIGGSGSQSGNSVQQTTDGGFILCGSNDYGSGDPSMYLVKTNEAGVKQWEKTFGSGGSISIGNSVQQTTDGGFILCGYKDNFFGSGMYLVKTNETGDLEWEKTFGGGAGFDEYGNSVQQTTNGDFIIHGGISSNMTLIKTTETGNLTWKKTIIGGGYFPQGKSIQQTLDDGFISLRNTGICEIIKTDENGNTY